jgi:hypothetical protein
MLVVALQYASRFFIVNKHTKENLPKPVIEESRSSGVGRVM